MALCEDGRGRVKARDFSQKSNGRLLIGRETALKLVSACTVATCLRRTACRTTVLAAKRPATPKLRVLRCPTAITRRGGRRISPIGRTTTKSCEATSRGRPPVRGHFFAQVALICSRALGLKRRGRRQLLETQGRLPIPMRGCAIQGHRAKAPTSAEAAILSQVSAGRSKTAASGVEKGRRPRATVGRRRRSPAVKATTGPKV